MSCLYDILFVLATDDLTKLAGSLVITLTRSAFIHPN
jgi:hypothetical protein